MGLPEAAGMAAIGARAWLVSQRARRTVRELAETTGRSVEEIKVELETLRRCDSPATLFAETAADSELADSPAEAAVVDRGSSRARVNSSTP